MYTAGFFADTETYGHYTVSVSSGLGPFAISKPNTDVFFPINH